MMTNNCIYLARMLTSMRAGTPKQLVEDYYMDYCEKAFSDFCDWHWPCNFQKKNFRCANVRSGHAKGHQNTAGKVMAPGLYSPSFRYYNDLGRWLRRLDQEINNIQNSKGDARSSLNVEAVPTLHVANMKNFYRKKGSPRKFRSHYTCFCCLREVPVHLLTCGHVLCSPCVRSYGVPKGRVFMEMLKCPICLVDDIRMPSCLIRFMPPLAGVRILCLDG